MRRICRAEAKDGVLKVLYKMRDQKVTRAIGITRHTDPVVLKTALEQHDFDCTQMALNAARAGMSNAPKRRSQYHARQLRDDGVAGREPQEDGRDRDEGVRPGAPVGKGSREQLISIPCRCRLRRWW